MSVFLSSERVVTHCARAKWIPQPDGTLMLAKIEAFSQPRFRSGGWESPLMREKINESNDYLANQAETAEEVQGNREANIIRAQRRAKIRAMDFILCNPDLDTFGTFTYAPQDVDRYSYEDCYAALKPWLSNRVQRKGLRYIIVPEHHKSGAIHFHGIMNGSQALRMERAYGAHTGKPLTDKGRPVFNLPEWPYGFTTAIPIGETETDRRKVAKYIFKYMGKQANERIGGRYFLAGGQLAAPVYTYGDDAQQLERKALDNAMFRGGSIMTVDPARVADRYERYCEIAPGLEYRSFTYI